MILHIFLWHALVTILASEVIWITTYFLACIHVFKDLTRRVLNLTINANGHLLLAAICLVIFNPREGQAPVAGITNFNVTIKVTLRTIIIFIIIIIIILLNFSSPWHIIYNDVLSLRWLIVW